VDDSAFYFSYFINNKKFFAPKLEYVGDRAFQQSNFIGVFNCPELKIVKEKGFKFARFEGDFDCPKLEHVGKYAFRDSNFTGYLNIPNLKKINKFSFANSNFKKINIGDNVVLGENCIGINTNSFKQYYKKNNKKSGIYYFDENKWNYKN
jgi:hypothetical protein